MSSTRNTKQDLFWYKCTGDVRLVLDFFIKGFAWSRFILDPERYSVCLLKNSGRSDGLINVRSWKGMKIKI